MFETKLNSSDNKNNEVTREIKQKCGILSTNNRGWSKAVNVISWNGGEDKLDIRDWNEDMTKCGKGISLTEEEAGNLYMILKELFKR